MNTSYFGDKKTKFTGSVPNALSLERATMESRAMKFLSTTDYDPTANEHKRVKVTFKHQGNHYGDLTMGSFVEDITGERALGFENAGSAIRAQLMEAKWTMKTDNGENTEKFGKTMLENFPQLGKEAWKGGDYGAKNLWLNLQNEGKRTDILNQHESSIAQAHVAAREAAEKRFDTHFAKFQNIASKGKLIDTKKPGAQRKLGNWWYDHKEDLLEVAAMPRTSKREKLLYDQALSKHRAEYVDNKMTRHGMATYDPATKKPIKSFSGQ